MHKCTHAHAHLPIYMHASAHTHMHKHTHIYTHTCINTHTYTHTHAHTHTLISTLPTFTHSIADMFDSKRQREPFDSEYILGLVWQQKKHVAIAAVMLVACTCSVLVSPVISGMLLEVLVKQQPVEKYTQVSCVVGEGEPPQVTSGLLRESARQAAATLEI